MESQKGSSEGWLQYCSLYIHVEHLFFNQFWWFSFTFMFLIKFSLWSIPTDFIWILLFFKRQRGSKWGQNWIKSFSQKLHTWFYPSYTKCIWVKENLTLNISLMFLNGPFVKKKFKMAIIHVWSKVSLA